MAEEVQGKHKYLLEQGWKPEEVEKYDVAMSERGMSPMEAYKYAKLGEEPKREQPSWLKPSIETEEDIEEKIEIDDEYSQEDIEPSPRKTLKDIRLEDIEAGTEKVVSGVAGRVSKFAKGVAEDIKKGAQEKAKREKELRETYEQSRQKARLERARISGRESAIPPRRGTISPERREPSLKDLGRGDLGAPRYEAGTRPPVKFAPERRDFLGLSSGFQIGTRSPMEGGFGLGTPINPMGTMRPRPKPVRTRVPSSRKPITKLVKAPAKKRKGSMKTMKVAKKTLKKEPEVVIKKEYVKPTKKFIRRSQDAADVLGLRGYF